MLALAGDDLRTLSQPGGFQEALIRAGEIRLIGEVSEAAAHLGIPPHAFASLSVQRFMERAGDDEWTGLLSHLHDSISPLDTVLTVILRRAVADVMEISR
ncbi:MAG: hypothetical protein ACR2PA_11440 [Hyphomicrobiaceae bacterium]